MANLVYKICRLGTWAGLFLAMYFMENHEAQTAKSFAVASMCSYIGACIFCKEEDATPLAVGIFAAFGSMFLLAW